MSGAAEARRRMVENQLAARGIADGAVLTAMAMVPREAFVDPALAEYAYDDAPLPIDAGQTISQPYMVALMLEALEVQPSDRVLEVGTGSGYAAAVLSLVAAEVFTIERIESLATAARRRLVKLGYDNVHVRHGDGTLGWQEQAPFDAVVVAAGGPEAPQALLEQLGVGGRLVIPIGSSPRLQELVRIRRRGPDRWRRESLGEVRFVPLLGAEGWSSRRS